MTQARRINGKHARGEAVDALITEVLDKHFPVKLGDKTVKIFEAKPIPATSPKGIAGKLGEIVSVDADGITVVCADGRFKVTRVQADAGKVGAGEWAKSANIEKGALLT